MDGVTVSEKQTRLTEDFAIIEDRQERLAAVVDHARRRPPLPAAEKNDAQRVPGCVSSVWLLGSVTDDRLHLRYDAESPLVKGLVGLLVELYDGAPPAEVISTEPTILADRGLLRDLAPTRQNGLTAVRARIKSLAQYPPRHQPRLRLTVRAIGLNRSQRIAPLGDSING